MDDFPTGADDDLVQPLGSPSDALFGLDNPDYDNPSKPISTGTPADERMPDDNADEAIVDFDRGDFSNNGEIADIAREPVSSTKKDIQTSTHIDVGNDERISSTAVGVEPAVMTSVSSIVEPEDGHQIEKSELQTPELRTSNFEIILPRLSSEERAQYTSITSDVINEIIEEVLGPEGEVWYKMEFTDGRQDVVSLVSPS